MYQKNYCLYKIYRNLMTETVATRVCWPKAKKSHHPSWTLADVQMSEVINHLLTSNPFHFSLLTKKKPVFCTLSRCFLSMLVYHLPNLLAFQIKPTPCHLTYCFLCGNQFKFSLNYISVNFYFGIWLSFPQLFFSQIWNSIIISLWLNYFHFI